MTAINTMAGTPKPLPIRTEALLQMLEDDEQVGVCTECGVIAQNVEPDAEDYRCPECGARRAGPRKPSAANGPRERTTR